jgi:ADP-ribosyl-[dinitrogen reductase] hydrolase
MGEWREDGSVCPVCGGVGRGSRRYPAALCGACVGTLVDGDGRPVRLGNTGPLGTGLAIAAGGQTVEDGAEDLPLFAGGVDCRAREAHFGGVVVQPLAAWRR